MAMDAVATMGGLLPDEAGGRDAVHVAVFSAVASERVFPGQAVARVLLEQTETSDARDTHVMSRGTPIGIVDPFLTQAVNPGERFWVYLFPRTITGLSHRWSHPAFEDVASSYAPPSSKLASEQWLRNFAQTHDCPGYETLMAGMLEVVEDRNPSLDQDYLHFNDVDAHGEIPPELWHHVEIVLGRPIKGRKPRYFSCSC